MRVVFVGSSSFGRKCLEVIAGLKCCQVVGVVTSQKTFKISYAPKGVTNVLHEDLRLFAGSANIPVLDLRESMNDPKLYEEVKALRPDTFLVVGWYHMIPKTWRELAPTFGLHASLLPKYRGGAPLVWAMINGEHEAGITLFQMDDGVDTGPIASQACEPIMADDTIKTLYSRIERQGLRILKETMPLLASGKLVLRYQEKGEHRVMPQRSPEDGMIDWKADSAFIERFIRAQTRPYPGAFTQTACGRLTIWAACLLAEWPSALPGYAFRSQSGNPAIVCGNGAIELTDCTFDNKKVGAEILEDLTIITDIKRG